MFKYSETLEEARQREIYFSMYSNSESDMACSNKRKIKPNIDFEYLYTNKSKQATEVQKRLLQSNTDSIKKPTEFVEFQETFISDAEDQASSDMMETEEKENETEEVKCNSEDMFEYIEYEDVESVSNCRNSFVCENIEATSENNNATQHIAKLTLKVDQCNRLLNEQSTKLDAMHDVLKSMVTVVNEFTSLRKIRIDSSFVMPKFPMNCIEDINNLDTMLYEQSFMDQIVRSNKHFKIFITRIS